MTETSASERMKEIHARRDEIRRESEERMKRGFSPFPTAEEVKQQKQMTEEIQQNLARLRRLDQQVLQEELDAL